MSAPRLRLLKFLVDFRLGGTESQALALARRLPPSRFDVRLACLRRRGPLLEEVRSQGIACLEYPMPSLLSLAALAQGVRLARDLRRCRVQVVHAYGFYINTFAVPVARLAGVPAIIASIRDTGDLWTRAQRRAQRAACSFADCVLVNAEAVRRRLVAEGYERSRIVIVRNGVDLSKFTDEPRPTGLRQELGLPAGTPLVAAISRLNPLKGIEYFLEAAAILAGRFPEARFLVAGDGAQRQALEGRAERLGLGRRAVFLGPRLDVPEILGEVNVSVLPSLSEALSNVLIESMAAGVPVVATDVGGNPEVVEDGVTGILVPPCDGEALARGIGAFLGDPARAARMGMAGKERAFERFSFERAVRETEDLYAGLLEGAGRSDTAPTERETRAAGPAPRLQAAATPRLIAAIERGRRELWKS
jgi:glycosyltransferase involved in cell wall biosynthesis